MQTTNLKSGIRDNRKRGKVSDFLLEKINDNSKLAIVSAYFTIYAYELLKDKLDKIEKLDFLFGEPSFVKGIDPDKQKTKIFNIENDEITLTNRLQQKKVAKDCADWINKKVNIKSIKQSGLLHGKMYHITSINGNEEAIMGSSNFTVRGLGISQRNKQRLP